MAHLRDIKSKCDEFGCTSQATKELYNCSTAPQGRYCDKHAQRRMKDQQYREDKLEDSMEVR